MLGSELLVGTGATDIFAVISEAARKFAIGIDPKKQKVFEGQVGNIQVQRMTAFIGTNFHASHRKIDACHQVLLFDLQSHLIGWSRLPCCEQATRVERRELVARRGDDPLDRFSEAASADGSPIIVPKTDATSHKIVGDLQIIVVRSIRSGRSIVEGFGNVRLRIESNSVRATTARPPRTSARIGVEALVAIKSDANARRRREAVI